MTDENRISDFFNSKIPIWSRRLRNRLFPTFHHRQNGSSLMEELTQGSSTNGRLPSNDNATIGRLHSDYTELMDGSIPCPSCNGSGLIPKELESTLVALIPVNDERLKPNKTWIKILIWIVICMIIAGIVIFLLMPKTVLLSSNHAPVDIVQMTNRTNNSITFYFTNKVNITSRNYLPVYFENLTAVIISKFQPWSADFVGNGINDTFTLYDSLPLYGSAREILFNNTVQLKGMQATFCQAPYAALTPIYTTLWFNITAFIRYYYGHVEQLSLSVEQYVCCIPRGNCTSAT